VIRFVTLGSVALTAPDGTHLHRAATQPKRLALLAYLACRPIHRRDSLLGVFWPHLDQNRARRALSRAVHWLRSFLGSGAIESVGRETLVLHEDVWVDAREFRRILHVGDLRAAVELYGGEFLDGVFLTGCHEFEEWLDGQRRRFRLLAEEAAGALVETAQVEGDPRQAVRWAERCLLISPMDETAVCLLVESLMKSGDRVGALSVYDRFRARLREEYGLGPGPRLRRLAAAAGRAAAQDLAERPPAGPD
jgi:DNA-binding SARP family transcriptional activator